MRDIFEIMGPTWQSFPPPTESEDDSCADILINLHVQILGADILIDLRVQILGADILIDLHVQILDLGMDKI